MRSAVVFLAMVACVSAIAGIIGSKRSIEVKGTLRCNGKQATDIKVKLYDNNLFVDGFMGESKSDSRGYFDVSGYSRSITNIEPKLNIYHRCGHIGICPLKLVLNIPTKYVTKGETPKQAYDVGEIDLATRFKGAQSTDCIN